jgi:hypothetical protein
VTDVARADRPRYRDLPAGDAAGVYGAEDVVGSLNLQSAASVIAAARLVNSGRVFSLNHSICWPDPPLYNRELARHHVCPTPGGNSDDYLDAFYPQASSQWDGFLHVADPELGHYNRRDRSQLGIERWAERGIVGRGVLLDVERFVFGAGNGKPDWRQPVPISVADLECCRVAARIEPAVGDIVLVRTGWGMAYQSASAAERAELEGATGPWPGLAATKEMAEYLWDWGVSAIAADNPSLEVSPIVGDMLHPLLLNRLGIPIGELWNLEELAQDCAADGRFAAFLTSAPLNVPSGIGSPANALAIK